MTTSINSSMFSMDRRAMEEARLARLAKKRGFGTSDIADEPPAKARKVVVLDDDDPGTPAVKSTSVTTLGSASAATRTAASQAGSRTSPLHLHKPSFRPVTPTPVQYSQGIIKKTWCFGFPRNNDIKIEEVLQKQTLKTGIICSFDWDIDWLCTKLDISQTKLIFVMGARNDRHRQQLQEDFQGQARVRLCLPPTAGIGKQHAKLMLLFHPDTHLRIVIPSGNVRAHDWGEAGGVMENIVFLIDLPRLPDDQHGIANRTRTNFYEEIYKFLDATGMYDDTKAGLLSYDWSKTSNMHFIHSIAGSATGTTIATTGYRALSSAVSSLGSSLPRNQPLNIDVATSSIGSLDSTQLETLQRALRGIPLQPSPITKAARPAQAKLTTPQRPPTDNLHIIYPSTITVQNSRGGPDAGGTLFCNKAFYTKSTFPAECMREYTSRRSEAGKSGPLSHSKIILARSAKHALVYVGSHNLSESAWGKVSRSRQGEVQCKVKNWECGVLVVIKPESEGAVEVDEADVETASEKEEEEEEEVITKKTGQEQVLPFSVFEDVIDVPFEWPARGYAEGDEPWCAPSPW